MASRSLLFAARARPSPVTGTIQRFAQQSQRRNGSSSSAHGAEASSDVFAEEGFHAPFWSKLAVSGLALTLFLRLSPSSNPASSSSDETPYLTRYIQHNLTPEKDLWRERNEKHLELAVQAADDKLLVQEAERASVRRLRYIGTFDQASPNSIPVGSQADLSDLVVKSEKDDFGTGKEE